MIMCCNGISCASAEINEISVKDSDISPVTIAIYDAYTSLSYEAGGLRAIGGTYVTYNNIAGVTIELQQYNNGWNTVKTWSLAQKDFVNIDEYYYPEHGYNYQLKTTYCAYNSNWVWLEEYIGYSDIVYY